MSISYRWLYFNEVDEVLFNYVLFDYNYDFNLLHQKVDTFNPFKMWLTVGYKLKK